MYDPPELVKAIEAADSSTRKSIMAESRVRRGEQGRNAHEPDVVAPSCWWLELHSGKDTIAKKFAQARTDLQKHHDRGGKFWRKAAVIHRARGARTVTATMTMVDLADSVNTGAGAPIEYADDMVTMNYETFLKVLRCEDGRPDTPR